MPEPAPAILVVGSTMIDLIAYADVLPEARPDGRRHGVRDGLRRQGREPGGRGRAARRPGRDGQLPGRGRVRRRDTLAQLRRRRASTRRGCGRCRARPASRRSGWTRPGMNRIICVPGANDETSPELAVAAFDAIRPVGRRRPVRDAAGDDRRRVRGAPGPRRHDRPQPRAGGAPIDRRCSRRPTGSSPTSTSSRSSAAARSAATGRRGRRGARPRRAARRVAGRDARRARRGRAAARRGRVTRVAGATGRATDTTGAGDAFVGAFAVGLALGWDAADAARLGCASRRTA